MEINRTVYRFRNFMITILIVAGLILLFIGMIIDRDWLSWMGGFMFVVGIVLFVQNLLEGYGFVPGA
jgi:uncharacterized membrane protein YgdD (TMEM256/DUF423 family)